MKKWLFLLLLLPSLCVSAFAQYLGHTNNGSLTETLWYDGSWINAARHQAVINLTVTNILAQVKATTGKYKTAIYAGDANAPITLLRGSYEVVNPVSDGWYSFPLTNSVVLTNGQYYWFTVWSDSTTAEIFYNTGTGTLAWAQYVYGSWPSPYTAAGVSSGQDYCIYVTNVVAAAATAPSITAQPVSQTVSVGSNVNFSVTAGGTAPLRYQWRFNNTNLPGATNTLLSLLAVSTNQAGAYRVRVTNSVGSVTSAVATLTVLTGPTNPPLPYVLARVTIAWDPSPDATVTGYNFYYGVATRTYTNTVNVGSWLSITVSNLVVGVTYYFAATAYNALGTESVFSDELVYTIPAYNPQLRSLTLNPTNVVGSNSVQGLVVLTERVLTNALIALTHNNTNAIAATPTNATVLVGNSNVTFIITTRTVTLTNSVNVLATFRGSTLTNVLMVRPATVVPTVPSAPLNFQFSPKP